MNPVLQISTLILIGFSIVASAILLVAYAFFLGDMRKSDLAKALCALLLGTLGGLQVFHLGYLLDGGNLLTSRYYVLLLFIAPPSFYLFSMAVLLPNARPGLTGALLVAPLPLAFVLPGNVAAMTALIIGAGYSMRLTLFVHGMRRQVRRFPFEMFFFAFFTLLSVFALLVGSYTAFTGSYLFFVAYADFVGIAFVLIVGALICFPELLSDMADVAQLSYAASTLRNVDVEAKVRELKLLMDEDKPYQSESLSLSMLASLLDLSAHQLSELINSRFGIGYPRFVREYRVAEAKRLLREDARSSVLAISMMTGFRSQSAFYAAFQEIEGEAPGQYRRKVHGA